MTPEAELFNTWVPPSRMICVLKVYETKPHGVLTLGPLSQLYWVKSGFFWVFDKKRPNKMTPEAELFNTWVPQSRTICVVKVYAKKPHGVLTLGPWRALYLVKSAIF